nr:flavodoxin family protein [bacterium]
MKSLILFDASSDQAPVCRIAGSLADALSDQGDTVTRINVREKTIACCTGCFGCWFKTPGECVVHDDGREIARELIGSDRVVIVSPVQFGSISSAMKRAVERQIPGISPLFQKWRGEWHHKDRYPSFPDFAVIGWLDSPDADAGKVFHNLFFRNQMNFRSHHSAVRVVHGDEKLDPVSFIEEWMDSSPGTGRPEPLQTLSDTLIREVPDADTVSPGHLLCLMGSP